MYGGCCVEAYPRCQPGAGIDVGFEQVIETTTDKLPHPMKILTELSTPGAINDVAVTLPDRQNTHPAADRHSWLRERQGERHYSCPVSGEQSINALTTQDFSSR